MNNRILFLFLITISFVTYFSCQKTSSLKGTTIKIRSGNDLVMDAKNYFVNEVRNNSEAISKQEDDVQSKRRFNHIRNLEKSCQWDGLI